jgi:hypothetical protein
VFWSKKLKGRELGRPRRRWEDNIRMDITGGEDVNWIYLAQDRGSCEHDNDPSDSIKSGVFLDQLSNY